jgi:hypothetical protein
MFGSLGWWQWQRPVALASVMNKSTTCAWQWPKVFRGRWLAIAPVDLRPRFRSE